MKTFISVLVVCSQLVRNILLIYLCVLLFEIFMGSGIGEGPVSTFFIFLGVIGLVIIITHWIPHFLKMKWPKETETIQHAINKPKKAYSTIAGLLLILIVIASVALLAYI